MAANANNRAATSTVRESLNMSDLTVDNSYLNNGGGGAASA